MDVYDGTALELLLYGFAHQVMDDLDLDERAVNAGLQSTDLIFVRDDTGSASAGYFLFLEADVDAVRKRALAADARSTRLLRSRDRLRVHARGEGPRRSQRALTDRIALAVKASPKALTPEEIAKRVKHENVASVTAAMHQITVYGKPKRLAGWIVRSTDGRYSWADTEQAATKVTKGHTKAD